MGSTSGVPTVTAANAGPRGTPLDVNGGLRKAFLESLVEGLGGRSFDGSYLPLPSLTLDLLEMLGKFLKKSLPNGGERW